MIKKILLSQNVDFEKPFLDIEQQLLRLKRRNLLISNDTATISALKQYSYYQIINGYGEPFEVKENHEKKYVDGTTFKDIYAQFLYDKRISEILLPVMLDIERHFKTYLSYTVAEHFDVNPYLTDDPLNNYPEVLSYLDPSRYPSNAIKKNISKIAKIVHTDKNPTAWYREHSNHIPPWILLSNATFGEINRYFQELPSDLKLEIADEMFPNNLGSLVDNQKLNTLFNMLEILREFRNCIAHGAKFSSFKDEKHDLTKKIKNCFNLNSSDLYTNEEYRNSLGRNDFFSLLIAIIILYPDVGYAKAIIKRIESFVSQMDNRSKSAFLSISNLPDNFLTRLKNLADKVNR